MESNWHNQLASCEELVPVIGNLLRVKQVELNIYGASLSGLSAIEILKAHRYARHVLGQELEAARTLRLAKGITEIELHDADIDAARLLEVLGSSFSVEQVQEALGYVPGRNSKSKDVVLYGFGRIGRLVARILLSQSGQHSGLKLRAIVVRNGSANDLIKRASLLRRDSVHGRFDGVIKVDEANNLLIVNGSPVQVIYASSPAEVDYPKFGISDALIIDNTGIWRDEAGLEQHLKCVGVAKVLLTAPGKNPLKNIVFGINHAEILPEDKIVTAASCTTNAITPVLKVINDKYGILHGHVETVHSFTNDQNLTDNFHKGERRGRSAPMNMVIAETGAAKAVAKALPELAGRLSGNAIRVPTPNVSLAILNLQLAHDATKESVNDLLRNASIFSNLHKQIDYVDSPEVVSTDFVGSNRAGVVDGLATIAEEKNAVIYVWYDNEFGYSNQVVRVAAAMAGLERATLPAR